MPASAHSDSAAVEVLISILGDRASGRLYKALVESKKAVSASADENMLHDPGYMMFSARTRKDGDLADAEKTMLGVIDEAVKEPPSKDEVDRARARMLTGIERQMNSSAGVGLSLSEWGSMGDWRLLFLNRDRIEKVTPEDVARVAKQYLKVSNRTLGRFIPEDAPDRATIPAAPDLVATLKDYKGKAAVEDGEAFDPSPANIEARSQRITLPSGMKLVLLPKKTRGGTVTASLELHWGDEQSLFGKGTVAGVTGSLLGRATKKHTRQQLQEEMVRLKAQVRVGGSATGGNASVSGVRATFADSLRLAAEMLREPAFPESEFAQLHQSSLAAAESRRSDPQAIANNQRSRYTAPYPAGDIRAVMTPEESIAAINKVTLDDVKKFYADFYGANHSELVVIGDFDPAEVQKLAVELFGDWKSPAPYKPVTRSWQKLEPVNRSTVTPDKTNAIFTMVSTMKMDQDDPDYLPMLVANFITGDDSTSRLWVRVREKDGLSYSVQTAFNAGTEEKFAQFTGIAICAPQNVPKVEADFKEELAKIVRDGFTAEEVEAAKKTLLQSTQAARTSDGRLVGTLSSQAHYGWTMQRTEDREKRLAGVTVAEVNAAVKKWLDPASFAIFKAGDFK
jgi:zinc protease